MLQLYRIAIFQWCVLLQLSLVALNNPLKPNLKVLYAQLCKVIHPWETNRLHIKKLLVLIKINKVNYTSQHKKPSSISGRRFLFTFAWHLVRHHRPELTLYEDFPLRGLSTHTPACRAGCSRRAVCALTGAGACPSRPACRSHGLLAQAC